MLPDLAPLRKYFFKAYRETDFPVLGPRYLRRLLIAIELIIGFQIYQHSKASQIQFWEEDEEISQGNWIKQGPSAEQPLFKMSRVLFLPLLITYYISFFKGTSNQTTKIPSLHLIISMMFFCYFPLSLPSWWNALLGPIAGLSLKNPQKRKTTKKQTTLSLQTF